MRFHEIIGVYHARGGLLGELSYVVGKLAGTTHCALCDLTHGWNPTGRADFARCAGELQHPWRAVHLDERDHDLAAFTDGRTPCVVGRTDQGLVMLLGPEELERVSGDVDRFAEALRHRLRPTQVAK